MTSYTARIFIAGPDGVTIADLDVSHELDAAMDILGDAGMLDEKRIKLLVAAEREGSNPEHLARHLVKLGKAARAAW